MALIFSIKHICIGIVLLAVKLEEPFCIQEMTIHVYNDDAVNSRNSDRSANSPGYVVELMLRAFYDICVIQESGKFSQESTSRVFYMLLPYLEMMGTVLGSGQAVLQNALHYIHKV